MLLLGCMISSVRIEDDRLGFYFILFYFILFSLIFYFLLYFIVDYETKKTEHDTVTGHMT